MSQGTGDIVSAAAFLIGAAAMTWESFDDLYQMGGGGVAHDPVFYPRILLAVIAVLALTLLVRGWRLRGQPGPAAGASWHGSAVAVAAAAAYVAAMPLLGFLVSSGLFLLLGAVLLGYRRAWPIALVTLSGPTVSWLVFVHVVRIPLPAGTLFG